MGLLVACYLGTTLFVVSGDELDLIGGSILGRWVGPTIGPIVWGFAVLVNCSRGGQLGFEDVLL